MFWEGNMLWVPTRISKSDVEQPKAQLKLPGMLFNATKAVLSIRVKDPERDIHHAVTSIHYSLNDKAILQT